MDNQKEINNAESEESMEKRDLHILMVGLDEAGKTSLLYKLKLGEDTENIPTIGYNVETVEYKENSYTFWDIGGRFCVRHLWKSFTENRSAVVFVVDAANPERFKESKEYLHAVMAKDDLFNAVLLVVANKQDKLEHLNNGLQLEEILDLKSLKQPWDICGTSAIGNWSLENILQNLTELTKNLVITKIESPKIIDSVENIESKGKHILMLGLDEAGKTALLYKLKLGKDTENIPTIGFNVETLEFKEKFYTFWDVGGHINIRHLWESFFNNKLYAVVFVVDAANPDRFEEAKQYLHAVMSNDDSTDSVLLVVANKQDKLKPLHKVLNLEECFDLKCIKQPWRICSSCAIGNWNPQDILQNLSEMIETLE